MTRKVEIDLVDAIGTFMTKTNQISDYIGDLDDLDSDFTLRYADSSIVSALNHVSDKLDSIGNVLFGGQGIIKVKGLLVDSAEFKRIRVGELTADSATIDSATIRNLTVTGTLYADSARFNTISVDSIGVEPGGILTIDSAYVSRMTVTSLTIDSATINRLTVGFADIDSAQIDSATINNLDVTTLRISGIDLTHAQRFTIKNEAGTAVLDGYFLSTDSDVTIA